MNNAITIMAIVFFMLVVGFLAVETGLAEETIEVPEQPDAPEGGLSAILQVARWAFNAVGAIFQLMTFSVDIPEVVNLLIISPIVFGVFYIGIAIVRGGAG